MKAILKVESESTIKAILDGCSVLESKTYPKRTDEVFKLYIYSQAVARVVLECTCDAIYSYCFRDRASYHWHIRDVKVYDVPKPISDFKTPPCEKPESSCETCKWRVVTDTPHCFSSECYVEDGRYLVMPPRDWRYVTEV